ncbi:MAG: hypothetical protein HOE45_08250 [Gammaproteobacteria bacterium]|jgi:hypothetical protein|nr:hypothetical protein [Gammaproteobacteria bacterium]MBT4146847.1 hypothetical protein [Gammaproteobacteria bacterium]MBT5222491.1 hypothetical protein [Gammaproteobacteria bacterium]MBT5825383.1 hypothetical protein [Gammaproteobacteria bacterium]MBT5967066.1 hypothetical protein [Gammaproteobacteria bacterium]
MQFFRICIFITTLLCLTQQTALAEEQDDTNNRQPIAIEQPNTAQTKKEFDPSLSQADYSVTEEDDSSSTAKDILSEIIIRPIAVVASATGFVLFIVASPFSGLASIPEPHDAFKTTWKNFVVTPYYFAFRRPFGDYSVELN